jgi:N-methylhydantoinase A
VVIPPYAGVFSALGLLCAPAGHQFVQTYKANLKLLADDALLAAVAALTSAARAELGQLGYPTDTVHFGVEADLRYVGQHFRVRVPLPDVDQVHPRGVIGALQARFEDEHQRRYGHRAAGAPVEIVGLHLTARVRPAVPILDLASPSVLAPTPRLAHPAERTRQVYFSREEGFVTTRILNRTDLRQPLRGPALIEEDDTTIVILPDCTARLDERGNVVIAVEG